MTIILSGQLWQNLLASKLAQLKPALVYKAPQSDKVMLFGLIGFFVFFCFLFFLFLFLFVQLEQLER